MKGLNKTVMEYALASGAVGAGIATPASLDGGPPSTDLSYVLPGARSAVCFALPLNQGYIEPYLCKKDHASHNLDNINANNLASGIAFQMAKFLEQQGHLSCAVASNQVYRTDAPGGMHDELPDLSHRYLAAASGVGWFGLSGNIVRKDTGAALVLGSVVTQAELTPTDPFPPEDNYCDQCGLCMASCFSGFMDSSDQTTVTMGGNSFTYSKRKGHIRCDYVCGGFAGLHHSGEWSTWSPSRFPVPDKEADFYKMFRPAAKAHYKRPQPAYGFYNPLVRGGRLEFTCGHCMLVCHPDLKVRKERRKMLMSSGVIIQEADGSRRPVTPRQAEEHLASMAPGTRALYQPAESG